MYVIAKKKGKDGKKWMQKAVKKPGALRKEMGVAEGKNIPVSDIESKLSALRKKKDRTEKDTKTMRRLNLALTFKKMKKKKSDVAEVIVKTADMLDQLGMIKEADVLDVVLDYLTASGVDTGIKVMENLPGYGPVADVMKQVMPGQEEKSEDPLSGTKKDLKLLGDVATVLCDKLPGVDKKRKIFKVKKLYVKPDPRIKIPKPGLEEKIRASEPGPDETEYGQGSGDSPSQAARHSTPTRAVEQQRRQDVEEGKSKQAAAGGQAGAGGGQAAGQQPQAQQSGNPAQEQAEQQGQQKQPVICSKCKKPFETDDPKKTECDQCSGSTEQTNPNQTPGAPSVPSAGQAGQAPK